MRNKIKKAFLIVLPTFYTENSAFLIDFQIISHIIQTVLQSIYATQYQNQSVYHRLF